MKDSIAWLGNWKRYIQTLQAHSVAKFVPLLDWFFCRPSFWGQEEAYSAANECFILHCGTRVGWSCVLGRGLGESAATNRSLRPANSPKTRGPKDCAVKHRVCGKNGVRTGGGWTDGRDAGSSLRALLGRLSDDGGELRAREDHFKGVKVHGRTSPPSCR